MRYHSYCVGWWQAAWRVFSPLLKELEAPNAPPPEPYKFGSCGPSGAAERLAERYGFRWTEEPAGEEDGPAPKKAQKGADEEKRALPPPRATTMTSQT